MRGKIVIVVVVEWKAFKMIASTPLSKRGNFLEGEIPSSPLSKRRKTINFENFDESFGVESLKTLSPDTSTDWPESLTLEASIDSLLPKDVETETKTPLIVESLLTTEPESEPEEENSEQFENFWRVREKGNFKIFFSLQKAVKIF